MEAKIFHKVFLEVVAKCLKKLGEGDRHEWDEKDSDCFIESLGVRTFCLFWVIFLFYF